MCHHSQNFVLDSNLLGRENRAALLGGPNGGSRTPPLACRGQNDCPRAGRPQLPPWDPQALQTKHSLGSALPHLEPLKSQGRPYPVHVHGHLMFGGAQTGLEPHIGLGTQKAQALLSWLQTPGCFVDAAG